MSLALYRKYRPSTFSEVIGQEHVTTPLSNALESGKIHHAYLFSGPRGCGKTSSARIMARSLNCEKGPTPNPCGQCQSCKDLIANGPGSIDVIELDAATHGLVDDARDLRDKAFFSPVSSKYKIYIIDEAHQLGPGAANALLKVVEEPPPHVLFIFATTEPEKLISTIRSRTHHYPFRLVPPGILTSHLESICKSEGIKVAKGVIPLVVRASGGSVRDALSVLGQLLAGAGAEGVTYEIAIQLLGYTDIALLDEAIVSLAARDSENIFKTIDRVIESGHDPKRFTQDLLERLRDLVIVAAVEDNAANILREVPEDQIERMRSQANLIGTATLIRSADIVATGLTQMRGATAPRLMLELICGRILLPGNDDEALISRVERLERNQSITPPQTNKEKIIESKKPEVKIDEKPVEPKKISSNSKVDVATLRRFWPEVVENVKKRRRLTWSLLSASAHVIAADDKSITIGIINSGAEDSFLRSGSDEILRAAFNDVAGIDLKIEAVVDSSINNVQKVDLQSTESPDDENQLSGHELLMKELGAKIISETVKE